MLMRLKPDVVVVEVTPLPEAIAEGFWTPGNLVLFRKPFLPEGREALPPIPPGEWIGYTHGIIVQVSEEDVIVVPYSPSCRVFDSTPYSPFYGHPTYLVGTKSHFLPYQDFRQSVHSYVEPRNDWYSVYDPNTRTRSWHLVLDIVDAPDGFLYGQVVVEGESSTEPRVSPVHCGGAHSHRWSF
ncbi:MAG: hypothetical protein ACRDIV_17645 [Ktedonobacteraceae bacterium]